MLGVWTSENRCRYDRRHLRYESDLTEAEWSEVGPLIPPAKPGGNRRTVDIRQVTNGVMYILSTGCQWQIVKRSDRQKGFVVLPKRWVVERTLAWLNRCRRLAKDWENLNLKARAFLLLASIRLMVRRLCRI